MNIISYVLKLINFLSLKDSKDETSIHTEHNIIDCNSVRLWIQINEKKTCPYCSSYNSMIEGPNTVYGRNIVCEICNTRYRLAHNKQFGAEEFLKQ